MTVIKRIGVGSAAKIFGSVYFFIGLIIGVIFSLVAVVTGGIAAASSWGHGEPVLGILLGVGAVVILPIFYGLLGLILGALVTSLYNVLARLVGGIEVELE